MQELNAKQIEAVSGGTTAPAPAATEPVAQSDARSRLPSRGNCYPFSNPFYAIKTRC